MIKKNPLEKFLYMLADFQTKNPVSTLFIIFAITIIFIGGISSVKTVASLEKMMPTTTDEVVYFNLLRDEFGGRDSLAVVIEVDSESIVDGIYDISDYEVILFIAKLQTEIDKNSKITSTTSLVNYLKFFNYKLYGNNSFPDEVRYYEILNNEMFEEAKDNFINYGRTTTMIVATTDVGTIDEQMSGLANKLNNQIENLGHLPGLKVSVTGAPVLQQKLGELINQDKFVTFAIAAVLILIAVVFIFRSFVSALTLLSMVIIAAIWLYGTMGYFNIPISTLAGGVASMVMGLGIDFGIHILHRYKSERAKGKYIREAVDLAVVKTGMAVLATSATTLVAFIAFVFGTMPEMGRFGILMFIGIVYSMTLSIFGLPAVLVLEEKIRLGIKRID